MDGRQVRMATRIRRLRCERFQYGRCYPAYPNQEAHHRNMTFEEEFIALLTKHGVEYDPRYVFG
jgi:hypothetical protein